MIEKLATFGGNVPGGFPDFNRSNFRNRTIAGDCEARPRAAVEAFAGFEIGTLP